MNQSESSAKSALSRMCRSYVLEKLKKKHPNKHKFVFCKFIMRSALVHDNEMGEKKLKITVFGLNFNINGINLLHD